MTDQKAPTDQKALTEDDMTEQMAELYRSGASLEEVGKKFGLTRQGIRYRFVAAGIERRRKKQLKYIDKKILEKMYVDEKMTMDDIAATFSVSKEIISRDLKFHQISKRKPISRKGYIVYFLKNLKLGETGEIQMGGKNQHYRLKSVARGLGIEVVYKSCGDNKYEVTRIG